MLLLSFIFLCFLLLPLPLSIFQHEFEKGLSPSLILSRKACIRFLYWKAMGTSWSLGWCWYFCWDKKDGVSSVARSSCTLLSNKLKLGWCPFYKDACIRPSLTIATVLWLCLLEANIKVQMSSTASGDAILRTFDVDSWLTRVVLPFL